jgi:hypothetical protein
MTNNKLSIHIEEINNGYLTNTSRGYDSLDAVYHKDILGVIKFIDNTYGAIHREHSKIKEEKKNEQR